MTTTIIIRLIPWEQDQRLRSAKLSLTNLKIFDGFRTKGVDFEPNDEEQRNESENDTENNNSDTRKSANGNVEARNDDRRKRIDDQATEYNMVKNDQNHDFLNLSAGRRNGRNKHVNSVKEPKEDDLYAEKGTESIGQVVEELEPKNLKNGQKGIQMTTTTAFVNAE